MYRYCFYVVLGCFLLGRVLGAEGEQQMKVPTKLRVAAAQMPAGMSQEENLHYHLDTVRICQKRKVDVVVFPECSVVGFESWRAKELQATVEASLAEIKKVVAGGDTYAIVGTYRYEQGRYWVSDLVIDPEGRVIHVYDKVFAVKPVTKGDHFGIFEVKGVKCSVGICRDVVHPELFRVPALQGAKVHFHSHGCFGSVGDLSAGEDRLARGRYKFFVARASENQMFFVVADMAGTYTYEKGRYAAGLSCVIHPSGNIILAAPEMRPDLLITTIDLNEVSKNYITEAKTNPFLKNLFDLECSALKQGIGEQ